MEWFHWPPELAKSGKEQKCLQPGHCPLPNQGGRLVGDVGKTKKEEKRAILQKLFVNSRGPGKGKKVGKLRKRRHREARQRPPHRRGGRDGHHNWGKKKKGESEEKGRGPRKKGLGGDLQNPPEDDC